MPFQTKIMGRISLSEYIAGAESSLVTDPSESVLCSPVVGSTRSSNAIFPARSSRLLLELGSVIARENTLGSHRWPISRLNLSFEWIFHWQSACRGVCQYIIWQGIEGSYHGPVGLLGMNMVVQSVHIFNNNFWWYLALLVLLPPYWCLALNPPLHLGRISWRFPEKSNLAQIMHSCMSYLSSPHKMVVRSLCLGSRSTVWTFEWIFGIF